MYKFSKNTEMTDKKDIVLTNLPNYIMSKVCLQEDKVLSTTCSNIVAKKLFFLAKCKFSFFTKTNPSPKTKSYSFSKFLQKYFEVRVTN